MRRIAITALSLCLGSIAFCAEPVSIKSLLPQMTDLSYLCRKAAPSYKEAQASSYDRASKGADKPDWFANGDAGQFVRVEQVDGHNEWVLADLKGPGTIVRFWSASPGGTVRFYFDGEKDPRIKCLLSDLLGGKVGYLGDPFAYVASSGWNLYFPIPYSKGLKITVDDGGRGIYYHVGYRAYTEPAEVKTFTWDQVDELKLDIIKAGKLLLDPDKRPLPEKTRTFDVEATVTKSQPYTFVTNGQAGAVYEVALKLENPKGEAKDGWASPKQWHNLLRNTFIRATFDGEKCIEAPLGDFFGSAPGINPFKTFPFEMKANGTMICRYIMPFAKSCKLEISTQSTVPVVLSGSIKAGSFDWTADTYHFKAQWLSDRLFTRPMKDMPFLNAVGEGTFVGSNLHIGNPVTAWWGEGDEKFYVDGESFPSTFGTGSEDYFGYAWCNPAYFTRPYHAQPRADGPGNFGHTSVARYHLFDTIPYTRSLRFDMELWHWAECTVDYDRTVYWYGKPGQTGPAPINKKGLPLAQLGNPLGVPGAVEGEMLKYTKTGGDATVQEGLGEASTGRHLWWTWMKVGDRLSVELPVSKAGTYELTANFTCAPDYGIHKVSVNGTPLKDSLDFYAPNIRWKKVVLGTFKLKAGVNLIQFECAGKNPKADDGWMLGLDYFLLKKK